MARGLKKLKLPPESELALLLRDITLSRRRLIVDTGEALYSVSVDRLDEVPRIPKMAEAARSREGILKAAGRWKEVVDAEVFKSYIYQRRRTSSRPSIGGLPYRLISEDMLYSRYHGRGPQWRENDI